MFRHWSFNSFNKFLTLLLSLALGRISQATEHFYSDNLSHLSWQLPASIQICLFGLLNVVDNLQKKIRATVKKKH